MVTEGAYHLNEIVRKSREMAFLGGRIREFGHFVLVFHPKNIRNYKSVFLAGEYNNLTEFLELYL